MIYFTADLHFGHSNIIKYCDRPFESVEEMNKTLIKNCNKIIRNKDHIYFLGDFCLSKKTEDVINKLNGKIHWIVGNHDCRKSLNKLYESRKIKWVKDYHEINYKKKKFILFHYPMEFWNCGYYGSIHLHGHSHNSKPLTARNRVDIGVDAWNYKPVSIDEVISFVEKTNDSPIVEHSEWFKEKKLKNGK